MVKNAKENNAFTDQNGDGDQKFVLFFFAILRKMTQFYVN